MSDVPVEPTGLMPKKGTGPPLRERPNLARGTCVDRYVILGHLGTGGMGVVYKAFDPELGRPIALKLLNTEGAENEDLRDRLLREAQALARLSHPNVVAVHDVGTFESDVFIAMEFVEGQTLSEWLKEKPRSLRDILRVFVAAGEGLAAAHRAGLVHRDFKPDNVIVGLDARPQTGDARAHLGDERVRVLDFGLVRDAATEVAPSDRAEPAPAPALATKTLPAPRRAPRPSEEAATRPSGSGRSLDTPLTCAGAIMGTPRYMAPEQHLGDVADARADQFSFCVSLYAALYGEFPFAGGGNAEFTDNVICGHIQEPPAGTRVPRWLRLVLLRGLAVEPGERHESMDALLALLAPIKGGRARWLTAGAAALVAVVTVGGVLGWRAHTLERAQLCQGGPARLAGVWDAAAKGRVHDALIATGKSYAPDAWTNVEKTLDRYTTRWVQMHKESCEATRLRGEQTDAVMTLRMACLDRKLQGVSALVNVLADADGAVLEKAGMAAAGLSSIEECADAPGLLAEVPPPSDPALRERIATIRAALSRAEALQLAGRIPGAIELAEKAVTDARETGNDVILAEALTQEGRGRAHLEPERAAQLLKDAFWRAFSTRFDRMAAAAATLAMREYALTLHSGEAALWETLAQAELQRIGGDDEIESDLWSARSVLAAEMRHFDDALQAASRAARLSERRFGLDHLKTVVKQENELNAISDVSRFVEAWQRRGPLLEREERLLGPKHPMVAKALMDLGDDEVSLGHLAEARAHLERSEALYREMGATNTVAWTNVRSYEVRLAEAEGKTSELDGIARETLAAFEGMGRGDSDMALYLRMELATNDARRGHEAEAIETLKTLMKDARSSHGEGYGLGIFQSALAEIHLRIGKLTLARDEIEQAVASSLVDSEEGSCPVADVRLVQARVLVAQGHAAEALALVDANEPPVLRALGDRAHPVAEARRTRGDALAALGRFDEAVAALQSSLAITESNGFDPKEGAATRAALSLALAKAGGGSNAGASDAGARASR
jgi:serine/threonine protein kinase/tetratricopeptide (TPR) repeat protein